jgi:hypothetical protein
MAILLVSEYIANCCRNYYISLQPRRRSRQVYLAAPTRLSRIRAEIYRPLLLSAGAMGGRSHFTSDVLTCVIRNGRGECSNAEEHCASARRRRLAKLAKSAPVTR